MPRRAKQRAVLLSVVALSQDPDYRRRLKRRRNRQRDTILPPVHPNAGIEAAYRAKLDSLVAEMLASTDYWLQASYRRNPPRAAGLAMDETPTAILQRALRELTKRWLKRFDEAAPKLAAWFAKAASKRSADALRKILKDGGFSIEFQMTPAMRDILG